MVCCNVWPLARYCHLMHSSVTASVTSQKSNQMVLSRSYWADMFGSSCITNRVLTPLSQRGSLAPRGGGRHIFYRLAFFMSWTEVNNLTLKPGNLPRAITEQMIRRMKLELKWSVIWQRWVDYFTCEEGYKILYELCLTDPWAAPCTATSAGPTNPPPMATWRLTSVELPQRNERRKTHINFHNDEIVQAIR